MIFVCTEVRDGASYGRQLDAADWTEAQRLCDQLGWRLDGSLEMTIEAGTGRTLYDREQAERAVSSLLRRAGGSRR